MPSLIATLGLNATSFKGGLDGAVGQANSAGNKIASALGGGLANKIAGLVSVAALQQGIQSMVEYGGHIQDLSQRLGISTEAVQAWDYALKLNGSTIDAATGFFEKLAVTRAKAFKGDGDAIAAFKKLGVSIDDLKSKRIEDIAEQIGDVFKAGDQQALIASLREVGGKGAGGVAAALRDGIREAREEAEKLGILIDDGTIKKLDAAGDRATQFGAQLRAAFAPAASAIIEGAQFMFYALKSFIAGIATVAVNGIDNILHPIDAAHKVMDAMKEVGQEYLDGRAAIENKKDAAPLVGGDEVKEAAENVKKIMSLREQLSNLIEQNSLKELSKEERLLALQEKRAELLKAMQLSQTEEGRLNAAIDIEKATGDIIALQDSLEKPVKSKRSELSVNENQKIGAFANLNSSNLQGQMLTESQRQTGLLTKIHTELVKPKMLQDGTIY